MKSNVVLLCVIVSCELLTWHVLFWFCSFSMKPAKKSSHNSSHNESSNESSDQACASSQLQFGSQSVNRLAFKSLDSDETSDDMLPNDEDAMKLMQERLPSYVVNCFVSSGFDSTEAICCMNVTDDTNNSIKEIENYVENHCNTDIKLFSNPKAICQPKPFIFPPGHRMKIKNFVTFLQTHCQQHCQCQQCCWQCFSYNVIQCHTLYWGHTMCCWQLLQEVFRTSWTGRENLEYACNTGVARSQCIQCIRWKRISSPPMCFQMCRIECTCTYHCSYSSQR